MAFDSIADLQNAISTSELLADISAGFDRDGYLPISEDQIIQLEKFGTICDDWSRIHVKAGADVSRIRGCYLIDDVYIGKLDKGSIFHCRLANTFLEDNTDLHHSNIENFIIREGATVSHCHEISCAPGSVFGNGMELPIAIETGGREVRIYAELNIPGAARIAGDRKDRNYLDAYSSLVSKYTSKASSDLGIIGKASRIINSKVVSSYIGNSAVIDNALLVEDTTVLSNSEEVTEISHGSFVIHSIVQWGCSVSSMAIVDTSLLTEHSHVDRHGMVTQSIVGPNSGVAEGEVTASLLGPFVGFHHQALLIAAFWPEGKGNIAYGANVGSNHPSRSPDQEIWPGEGLFIGLGAHIKFPSDFTRAPYTIIASAVTTLSERVEFPFSLLNVPAATFDGISPAYNEIYPGWVLSDNLFMIKRNEGKYQKRNKARRSTFEFEVFRPDIVDLMIAARERLCSKEGKTLYTQDDIAGLGKNYMIEQSRVKGIITYTFYIRYYALTGLRRKLARDGFCGDIMSSASNDPRWEHERLILIDEFGDTSVCDLLDALSEAQKKIAENVQKTKEKDDARGKRIIDDYETVHESAGENSFVRQVWAETENILAEIKELKKTAV